MYIYTYIYICFVYAETPSPLETIPGRILNHEPFRGCPAKWCGVSSQKYIQVVYDRTSQFQTESHNLPPVKT